MTAPITQIYALDAPRARGKDKPPPKYKPPGSHTLRLFLTEETYQGLKHASLTSPSRMSMVQLAMEAPAKEFKPRYAYASDKRFYCGRPVWEHLNEAYKDKVIQAHEGNEDRARKEYVLWCRSHPVFC